MSFPEQAIKTIIAYLTGTHTGTVSDVIKAVLEVLDWLRWLIFESGFVTTAAVYPQSNLDVAAVSALQDLLTQHQSGAQPMAFNIPTWLLPILIELLKRLMP